jgi:hypothetical protein
LGTQVDALVGRGPLLETHYVVFHALLEMGESLPCLPPLPSPSPHVGPPEALP